MRIGHPQRLDDLRLFVSQQGKGNILSASETCVHRGVVIGDDGVVVAKGLEFIVMPVPNDRLGFTA